VRRALGLVLLAAACGGEPSTECDGLRLEVLTADGAHPLCATVASTETARREGLGARAALQPGEALLLTFPVTGELCVHGAGVPYPFTAAWLHETRRVLAVEHFAADEPEPRCHDDARELLELLPEELPALAPGDRVREE